MEKKKLLSSKTLIFVLIILLIIIIVFINNTNKFSKDINSKIELVKNSAKNDIYFPFEDGNKQYILLGYRISSYSDSKKSSMNVKNTNYKNGDLVIELEIDEVRTSL